MRSFVSADRRVTLVRITAAGARIVVEAKESASCDLVKTLEEADTARRNRQASVCVFVHSTKSAPAGIPVFSRYGHDIVVKWDADDDAHEDERARGDADRRAAARRVRRQPPAGGRYGMAGACPALGRPV